MSDRKFYLLVPTGYYGAKDIDRAFGAPPGTNLSGLGNTLRRRRLPVELESFEFNHFGRSTNSDLYFTNFFHCGDFFVVNDELKKFLERESGCTFEVMRLRNSRSPLLDPGQYWAMKVTTRIDCIDADRSFSEVFRSNPRVSKSFRELASEVPIPDGNIPDYANRQDGSCFVYPQFMIENIELEASKIPSDVRLFELEYFPYFLIIDSEFSHDLFRQFRGGSPGYYCWTIGLRNVYKQYDKEQREMR